MRPALDITPMSEDDPLPSIDLHAIKLSQSEVAAVFHLPLTTMTAPSRMRSYLFRGRRPYTAIDVTDLIQLGVGEQVGPTAISNEERVRDNVDGVTISDTQERMEVWGLTGWYLSLVMRALRVYQ